MEVCPKCGLPIQACMCEEIGKSQQNIKIETIKRKYGKLITTVAGLSLEDSKKVAKELKQGLACGGTVKNGIIELQGDHKDKIKSLLIRLGFKEDLIED
jgi:translation initiation factor 1